MKKCIIYVLHRGYHKKDNVFNRKCHCIKIKMAKNDCKKEWNR